MHLIVIFGLCLLFFGFARTLGAFALIAVLITGVLGLFVLYDHVHNPDGWKKLDAVYEAQRQQAVQEDERHREMMREFMAEPVPGPGRQP
jgi:hypothetical protein